MLPLLLASAALAGPVHEVVVPLPPGGVVDPDDYDALLEEAAGAKPDDARSVRLVTEEGRPLRELLPVAEPVAGKPERQLISLPMDHPGAEDDGGLAGKAVYVSQCHGFIWYDSLDSFSTQRGEVWDTVEDFHNPEGANFWLTRYLENAGAGVFTARERDPNPLLVVVDDGDPGYAESGAGFQDGLAGFADAGPWDYGDDPFDAGGTRTFPADGGGVATWTPDVPADGWYAVYVTWDSDPDHATDAHYRLTHPGGVIDRWFDQTVHGSTWQYAETLWLTAGESLTVELIGDGSAGRDLSADAVRIGGGMGDVRRYGETTGRPRWEEGAILYNQWNGAPSSVYDPFGDGDGSDPTTRSKWAEWEHPAGEDAVYLSWHSNAFDGSAYGTITYFAGGGADATSSYDYAECGTPAVTGSYSLANAVQEEMMDAFTTWWDAGWNDRGLGTACFSEVSPSNNDEMPAVLVELAFHDNEQDALFLKHPRFRRDAARAMYRGIVRYFAERDGVAAHYLPEPPDTVAMVHDGDGGLALSWSPGPSGAPFGDAADGYRVYLSTDGKSWDNGADVAGTSTTISASPGQTVYAKVAAVNEGGVSFGSEVVGARLSPDDFAPVLVVAAFDRLDRGLLNPLNVPGVGDVVRMDLYAMNRFDVAADHGNAIAGAGWYFDAVSDEAAATLDLSAYDLVVWATGEESTVDETFSTAQQDLIRAYLDAGGTLWTSGAEILWDLDYAGSDDDRAFATDVLGATMASDAATSTDVDGQGLLAGVGPMDFDLADGAPYPVEYPDVLAGAGDVIATYGDGSPAALFDGRVAIFGFPFETVGDPAVRVAVAGALLEAMVDYDPPDPGDGGTEPPTVDTDPGDDPTRPGSDPRVVSADERKGCGCASAPAPAPLLCMLTLLLATLRRRR